MGFDLVLDTTDTLKFLVAYADGESAYQSVIAFTTALSWAYGSS